MAVAYQEVKKLLRACISGAAKLKRRSRIGLKGERLVELIAWPFV